MVITCRSRLLLLNYLGSTFITRLWEWILRPDSLPLSYMSPYYGKSLRLCESDSQVTDPKQETRKYISCVYGFIPKPNIAAVWERGVSTGVIAAVTIDCVYAVSLHSEDAGTLCSRHCVSLIMCQHFCR